jgi:hypothetical protein
MFLALLAVTFLAAAAVAALVAGFFQQPIATILQRIFIPAIAAAWHRYMTYAIYVVGISGGVHVWSLEQYLAKHTVLTRDQWVLEVYRTILQTLQSTAWLLFVFFAVAVIAYGILRRTNREAAA